MTYLPVTFVPGREHALKNIRFLALRDADDAHRVDGASSGLQSNIMLWIERFF